MSHGDVVAMAKGRMGGNGVVATKKAASGVPGGAAVSPSEDVYDLPLIRRFVPNSSAVKKFAEKYERGEIL